MLTGSRQAGATIHRHRAAACIHSYSNTTIHLSHQRHNRNHVNHLLRPTTTHHQQHQHQQQHRPYTIQSSPSTHPTTTNTNTITTTTNIPSQDLSRLNQTSAILYRILLRRIRAMFSSSPKLNNTTTTDDDGTILLQPKPILQDYGQARILDADVCSVWSKPGMEAMMNMNYGQGEEEWGEDERRRMMRMMMEDKIVAFFKEWDGIGYDVEEIYDGLVEEEEGGADGIDGGGAGGLDFYPDRTVSVTRNDLEGALRRTFRRIGVSSSPGDGDMSQSPTSSSFVLTKAHVVDLQRFAIDAMRVLDEQDRLWEGTSVSVDLERGIRTVATSAYIGKSIQNTMPIYKHRFAYRIRIEKFAPPSSSTSTNTTNTVQKDKADNNNKRKNRQDAIQILGRAWNIQDDRLPSPPSPSSPSSPNEEEEEEDTGLVTVRAPYTGVVGHLPVLRNRDIFEYMSGCELGTRSGTMDGHFHMAWVDYGSTVRGAQVGDPVEALEFGEERKFESVVRPFRLIADGGVGGEEEEEEEEEEE